MVKRDDVDGGQVNESGENIVYTTAQKEKSSAHALHITDIVNVNNWFVLSPKILIVQRDDGNDYRVNESRKSIDCNTAQQDTSNVYVLHATDIVNVNNQSVLSPKVLKVQRDDVDGGQVNESEEIT